MRRAVSRAASSGTFPERVTTPSFAVTLTAADLSDGSENILALMPVVMVSSVDLLLQEAANAARRKAASISFFDLGMKPRLMNVGTHTQEVRCRQTSL
jgi:phosphosulfolactate phosphohydrolase-like enzyme